MVFIHGKENASFDRKAGITVNQVKGFVRIRIINLESAKPLSENRDVKWVAPSQFLKPMMDVAPEKEGLPAFQNKTKLKGKGIEVGVVFPVHQKVPFPLQPTRQGSNGLISTAMSKGSTLIRMRFQISAVIGPLRARSR